MEVTAKELSTRLEGTVLVDIRRAGEWHLTGVIPGSHPLTFFDAAGNTDSDAWLRSLAEVASPEDDLVLICRSGHRTGVILGFLRNQTPYSRAQHLAGGILSWLEKGLPVVAVKD